MLPGIFIQALTVLLPLRTAAYTLNDDTFDPRTATTKDIHHTLFTNQTTCRGIISSFLARIEAFNPVINAIISLNPDSLSVADHLDAVLSSSSNITSLTTSFPLFCVPVLLKDNFDFVPLPTTAGSRALALNFPSEDAPSVQALSSAGAVILGKTNMHDMALEGLTVSSFAGQTRNPYDLSRTPGGSSGGSGAAVAAGFAVLAMGTDTMNSVRSPASAGGLVGVRPSRGAVSRRGVVPVSWRQDAVGIMGRSVEDVGVGLRTLMGVGVDPQDNATWEVPGKVWERDSGREIEREGKRGVRGRRFGLLTEGYFNFTTSAETDPVNGAMRNMVSKLTAAGAAVINISDPLLNPISLKSLDVQIFEYPPMLTSYLSLTASHNPPGSVPPSFRALYTQARPNRAFLVLPAQSSFLHAALKSSPSSEEYHSRLQGISRLREHLLSVFKAHDLDALIYPEQQNLVVPIGSPNQYGRNGLLAALTGFPVVCVPVGFSPPTDLAPAGVPIGMEVLGQPWSEGGLLGIAKSIEYIRKKDGEGVRVPPWVEGRVPVRGRYERVPEVRVDERVPKVYPLGVF